MREFIVLLILLLSSAANALTLSERALLCRVAFPAGVWVPSENFAYEKDTEELLRRAGFPHASVLCVGSGSWSDVGQSIIREDVFVVGLGMSFVRKHPDMVRAVIAHEVAHLSVDSRQGCNRALREERYRDFTDCESGVDREASRMVGVPAIVSMLSALKEYVEQPIFSGMVSLSMLLHLEKRIQLAKKFPD